MLAAWDSLRAGCRSTRASLDELSEEAVAVKREFMNWIKQSQIIPILQLGISFSLGVSATVVVLILAVGLNSQPQVKAAFPPAQSSQSATMVVTFTLDDFDDRKRPSGFTYDIPRGPNDFFANQGQYTRGGSGAVITDSLTCPFTYSCYLSLAYDVSVPNSEGGYVEELGYSYTYSDADPSTWALRDMRACDAFRFRVRGDAVSSYTTRFDVEFVGPNWGLKDHYLVTGVTTAWQAITIPLDSLTQTVVSQLKQIAVRLLDDEVTAPVGALHFDDFAFTGCRFESDLLDLIERQAFLYFWENRHPDTGFVRDRAVDPFYNRDVTSVAAVGFELATFGIGAERGWISRTDAALATRQVMSSLLALPQGPAVTGTSGYKGFFYHLLNIDTGLRTPDSEVSTIDSALLMAGVLFARQYYTGTNQTETDIQNLADQLYNRVEWNWMLRTDPQPSNKTNQLYMAWKPERHDCGESNYQNCYEIPDTKSGHGYFSGELITDTVPITHPTTWDYYTDEILLLNLLAIGSPTHSVPTDTFSVWARELGTYDGYTLYQSWFGQLFAHFIGQVWLDLRGMEERNSPYINWWLNSRQAVLANRQFAIDNVITCSTYSTLSWGLSTSLGPPNDPTTDTMDGVGVYRGYGALPRRDPAPPLHDCTLAPYAAASSMIFLSANPADNEAYQALDHWFYTQPRLWGLYGFRDGFNLNQGWYAHDYIGIDQGMTLLALENYRTRLIWSKLRREPVVARAIATVLTYRSYLPIILK